jgi:hypothetical protein
MADQTALMQNIDKLSYGVAGVLGLALIAWSVTSGGDVKADTEKIGAAQRSLTQKIREAAPETLERRYWADELRRQWTVSEGTQAKPRWIHERAPLLVKLYAEAQKVVAFHGAPQITIIECRRDKQRKRPYLRVAGHLSPDNALIDIQKLVLERREEDGPFVVVSGFKPDLSNPRGSFEHADYEVKPGKKYTYRLISTAAPRAGADNVAPLPPEEATKEIVLGPTDEPVPYDLSFLFTTTIETDAADPNNIRASVNAAVQYWDYDKDEPVTVRRRHWKEGERIGGRYLVRRMSVEDRKVSIRDTLGIEPEYTVPSGESRKVTFGPPKTPEAPAPSEEESEEEGAAEPAPPVVEEKPPPAPPQRPPRRRFGE